MKLKRLIPIVLCVVFAFSLAACDKGGGKSEVVDTGVISAVCPAGWSNSPVKDIWSDDENAINDKQLQFLRTDDVNDISKVFSADSVNIYYYDENSIVMDSRDYYDNTEDLTVKVNGETWTGYTGETIGYPMATLYNPDESIQVTFIFQQGDIDINSDVSKEILESITID